jgi:hypothetical protein
VPKSSLTSEQVLSMLAEAPPRIAGLTAGLTPAQLLAGPNQGEWSANERRYRYQSSATTDLFSSNGCRPPTSTKPYSRANAGTSRKG